MHVDIFSGGAASLPKAQQTPEGVLEALRANPRVSTWDMSEMPWLVRCIQDLERRQAIALKESAYPWLRYSVLTPMTKEPSTDGD